MHHSCLMPFISSAPSGHLNSSTSLQFRAHSRSYDANNRRNVPLIDLPYSMRRTCLPRAMRAQFDISPQISLIQETPAAPKAFSYFFHCLSLSLDPKNSTINSLLNPLNLLLFAHYSSEAKEQAIVANEVCLQGHRLIFHCLHKILL